MSIIYDNKTHMYIAEVNREDRNAPVLTFTSSPTNATRFEEKDRDLIAQIKEIHDVEIIELD